MVKKALSDESMSDFPLVSVIVPVYNMERYLAETLESVLKSDYPNFEVIVVDDGSEDNSRAIAEEFMMKDHRVKLISQPNAGVSSARNNGIKSAKGEFILPVDADDLISSDYIKKCVSVLMSDQEIKVVYAKAEFFGDKIGEWKLPSFNIGLLARKNIIYVSGMYRKKDFEVTEGYSENIAGMEDWDFWISLLKTGGKVVCLNSVCLYYRITSQSKRLKDRKRKKQIIDQLNERHADFFHDQLGGKLHYNRSWSRLLNKFHINCF